MTIKESIRIKYDGPILDGHSIDVNDLAPALLSLADLCQIANKRFNGDLSSVSVMVNADLEQNCFELNLELAQTLYEQVKLLIGNSDVATLKEILEWLGIISTPIAGVFATLVLLDNKSVENKELVKTGEGKEVIKLSIKGNNNHIENIHVYPQTIELLKDPNIIKAAQMVVKPVTKAGYDSVEFIKVDDTIDAYPSAAYDKTTITKEDATKIMSADKVTDKTEDETIQEITAWISVYAPVLDKNAEKWRFTFNDTHEYMDISETNIAEMAISRGGVGVGDLYKVALEIRQSITSSGKISYSYKINKLIDFKPSQTLSQERLF